MSSSYVSSWSSQRPRVNIKTTKIAHRNKVFIFCKRRTVFNQQYNFNSEIHELVEPLETLYYFHIGLIREMACAIGGKIEKLTDIRL